MDTEAQADRSHRGRRGLHGRHHHDEDGTPRRSKCAGLRALEYLVVFFLLVGWFSMPGLAQIIVGSVVGGLSVIGLCFHHIRLFVKRRRQAKLARFAARHAATDVLGSPDSKDALLPGEADAAPQVHSQEPQESFLALSSQQRERMVEILQPILRQAQDQSRAFATALGAAYTAGRASWAQDLNQGGIRLAGEESPLLDPNAPEYDAAAVPLSLDHSMVSPKSFDTAVDADEGSGKERQSDI